MKRWDRWLLIAVVLSILMGLQGFRWGTYDCLNLDAMALKNVLSSERPPLHPGRFVKPPFYTYINHFLARVPAQTFASNLFWLDNSTRWDIYLKLRLALARVIQLSIFSVSVVLLYLIIRQGFGLFAARLSVLLYATSAGLLPYRIFLTTDIPVLCLMLAAFYCALKIMENPGMGWSVAAGLLTGLATATKYNGLAIAIVLPLAHLMAGQGHLIGKCLRRPSAWVCGLCVPLGFLLGNPYALLDFPKFWSDFSFNLIVTPVYGGNYIHPHGYWFFLLAFYEIIGKPVSWLLLAGIGVSTVLLCLNLRNKQMLYTWLLAAGAFGLYYWEFGSFPRVETRFVLPTTPYVFILAAPALALLHHRSIGTILAVPLVLYNLACGWEIGRLFRQDPRNEAISIIAKEDAKVMTVEMGGSIPLVQHIPGKKVTRIRQPTGLERQLHFDQFFEGQEAESLIQEYRQKETPEWFSMKSRLDRGTDYVLWSTIDLEQIVRNHYEAMRQENPYFEIIFDKSSPSLPAWVYPQNTEFIRGTLTIWRKKATSP